MAVDFTTLPAPRMVEELDYQVIKIQMLEDLRLRDPAYTEIFESDPGVKIIEVAAFREMLLRQRINDAYMGVLIRYALGGDLDNLGAFYGITRLAGEADLALRERIRIRIAGSSSAGPPEWYQSVALAVSPLVLQVGVSRPEPGQVLLSVLSGEGGAIETAAGADLDALGLQWGVERIEGESDSVYRERVLLVAAPAGTYGTASPGLLQQVFEAVNADDIRVVTDDISVASVEVVDVDVTADVYLYPTTPVSVFSRLETDLRASFDVQAGIGWDVTRSWLIGALQAPGVQRVELAAPANDVIINGQQAARLRTITLTLAGRDR